MAWPLPETELDGSMELAELHRTIHGRTVERDVVSGEMYRKTKKTRI